MSYSHEKPNYQPAPTELEVLKRKLRAASRIATAATTLEKFQDIPQLRGVTAELTLTLKDHLAGLGADASR